MKKHALLSVIPAAVLTWCALPMAAQEATPAATPAATKSTAPAKLDQDFSAKAAEGGLLEVELGKLAAKNAAQPEVKAFGERMIADHGKIDAELKALAAEKGIPLPDKLQAAQTKKLTHLASLKGEAFDKAYLAEMLKDHETDVAEFRATAGKLTDPELKAFAEKTLPTLEAHLQSLHEIKKERKGKQGEKSEK